jgi:regulator of sigma E protease
MTHSVSQQGLIALMKFMALLSVSLAAINFLPLPALDGGRFLFILVEIIRGKRANARWEAAIHGIGFILLMLLIGAITYKDILRLIIG